MIRIRWWPMASLVVFCVAVAFAVRFAHLAGHFDPPPARLVSPPQEIGSWQYERVEFEMKRFPEVVDAVNEAMKDDDKIDVCELQQLDHVIERCEHLRLLKIEWGKAEVIKQRLKAQGRRPIVLTPKQAREAQKDREE